MHGYLGLILTGHVPYLRAAGRYPTGEDALHETIAQAIVPTLNALFDLRELGLQPTVALAYSPLLLEQLGDTVVQKHFIVWMEEWIAQCETNCAHWHSSGETHREYLAHFYLDWAQGILRSFTIRYGRDLIGAIRELCSEGTLEPMTVAATHPYLPLLGRHESVRAQLTTGTLNITRQLGRRPRGLWLPECGYRPEIEPYILTTGVRYIIVDPSSAMPDLPISGLRPRWIVPRRLAAFLRDEQSAEHIWSPALGYLGDPLYRSLQRDPTSGLALWRNGHSTTTNELYDPYDAFQRAQEHAAHFSTAISAQLEALRAWHDRPGIAIVPLDAELLGRRWFEGTAWLRALIEEFVDHPTVTMTVPSAYLRAHRPRQGGLLREGSWGYGGDHRAWAGQTALAYWQAIHQAEDRFARLVRRFPNAQGERERVMNQALRELLLAQSSDWSLLLSQGSTNNDAWHRPHQHLERYERLCLMAEESDLLEEGRLFLEQVEELDNPFLHLNYRVYTDAG